MCRLKPHGASSDAASQWCKTSPLCMPNATIWYLCWTLLVLLHPKVLLSFACLRCCVTTTKMRIDHDNQKDRDSSIKITKTKSSSPAQPKPLPACAVFLRVDSLQAVMHTRRKSVIHGLWVMCKKMTSGTWRERRDDGKTWWMRKGCECMANLVCHSIMNN